MFVFNAQPSSIVASAKDFGEKTEGGHWVATDG
jgi:hypothetical protein